MHNHSAWMCAQLGQKIGLITQRSQVQILPPLQLPPLQCTIAGQGHDHQRWMILALRRM